MSELLSLHITKLHCYRQDEKDGDEIFIRHNKKKIWPEDSKYQRMEEGKYDLNIVLPNIEVDNKVELELWDYDFLTPNDLLGTFLFHMDKWGGPYKTDIKTDAQGVLGKYMIEWSIKKA